MHGTFSRPMKILASVITVAVLVAGILAWSTWRKKVTAAEHQQAQAQQLKKQQSEERKKAAEAAANQLTDEEKQQYTDLAIKFEQAARNWGSDPTINLDSLSQHDTQQVIDQLRTPDIGSNPLPALSAIPADKNDGPDAVSYPCEEEYENACKAYPTMKAWWNSEALATGSRWTDGPHVTVNEDRTVTVTGKVESILLQDGDSFNNGSIWALTPAWRNYDINDELTIANGKISGMNINGDNPWWINPWLTRWDNNMADDLSEGTRIAIPVKGDPEMGLAHSSMTPILKGPVTQSDLDGKVDWHLWDSIPMASVGGGCQNPGYCG